MLLLQGRALNDFIFDIYYSVVYTTSMPYYNALFYLYHYFYVANDWYGWNLRRSRLFPNPKLLILMNDPLQVSRAFIK